MKVEGISNDLLKSLQIDQPSNDVKKILLVILLAI